MGAPIHNSAYGVAGMIQREGLGIAKAALPIGLRGATEQFECKHCHVSIPLEDAAAVLEHMHACEESAPAAVEFRKHQEERAKELAKLCAGAQNMGMGDYRYVTTCDSTPFNNFNALMDGEHQSRMHRLANS